MYYIHAPRMMELPLSHIRAEPVKNLYQPYGLHVDVLRLDELHPIVSGNKWFKLRPWLERALAERKRGLLTFGGPWSNHLLATAEACRGAGIEAVGIVRGEEPATPSATLIDAAARGMRLFYSDRAGYRAGLVPGAALAELDPDAYLLVPEGGYGPEGRSGAARIASVVDWEQYSHVLAAVGTGTTLAGLVAASAQGQQCIGISVLKNNHSLQGAIEALLTPGQAARFTLLHDYHEGGYARSTPALLQFMNDWYEATGIPSDFVYTGKLFYAADCLIRSGSFEPGSRVLLLHSGGLQGNRSLPPGTLIF
ncbi:1-aminocyclopropane-1-carboxylate deaminase/D-cysteine desulfhydrase [Flaviaesturariibacter terrae]